MKRILSMMLVVMMIATSFTCIAFAADGTGSVTIGTATVKNSEDATVTVTVNFNASNVVKGGFQKFTVKDAEGRDATGITLTEKWENGLTYATGVEVPSTANGATPKGDGYMFMYAKTQNTETVAGSFTVSFKVEKDTTPGIYTVDCDASFGDVTPTKTTGTITVQAAYTINAVETLETVKPDMLTSKAGVIAKLPTSVKITEASKNEYVGQTVDVVSWECADYSNTKKEAQTFIGTLKADEEKGVSVKEGLTAIATVELQPLTTATANWTTQELTVKKNADGAPADLKKVIEEAVKTISLVDADGNEVDTIDIKFDAETDWFTFAGDLTNDGKLDTTEKGKAVTATITVPAGTESVNGIYKLADAMTLTDAVKITVKASSTNNSVGGIGVNVGGNTITNNGTATTPSDDKKDDDATTTPDDDKKDDDATTTPDDDKKDDDTNNPPAATEFGDVPADYWAFDFITTLKDMGIINGKDNGNFEPDAQLTRAEFAKMIAVAFGLTATSGDSKFADCTANDWYTEFVNAVAEAGYVNGKDDANFGANDPISRQEICTILGRILGVEDAGELNFTDADSIADWAQAAVSALVEMGVVNGYEDGTFNGAANATRAEVAKMLVTFLTAVAAE